MNINDHIKYWIDSSDDDFQATIHLFEKGDNNWALFVGHLALEKLLKTWYIKANSDTPPFIHDLVRLSEKGNLPFDEDQKDILDTISAFNIRGRYDDYKRKFHKKCSNSLRENGLKISRSSENG